MGTPQTYSNHARLHPLFHFFVIPVLFINVVVAAVWVVKQPGWLTGWLFIVSLALASTALLVRVNPLKVQDRIIRLEERLRLLALLPEPLRLRIPELTERQLIAMRFAADSEVEALMAETLEKNLSAKEIKSRIENWRPDYSRV